MKWIEAVTRPGDDAEIRRRVLAVAINHHPRRLEMLDLEQAVCVDDAEAVHRAWNALPDDALQAELNYRYRDLFSALLHFGFIAGAADPAPSWWPPAWLLLTRMPRMTRNV